MGALTGVAREEVMRAVRMITAKEEKCIVGLVYRGGGHSVHEAFILFEHPFPVSTPWSETSRFSKHRSISTFVACAVKYHLLALSHRSRVVGSTSIFIL